ncbi:hypothetical protein C5Y96_22810 [Blastopirellula marina]|uniref:Carboxypeptidase regulatory-like domain-containing protein n=1 Tax=Blastopirellula marina TaxID=124 RepID=A0A2S8F0F7_9BACT|nr:MULTISPECIES: hypothetical protein [Pirellulaceae]PQO25655.1 hypothetical protein C5Y96_22810 [Blastopirellula marina]RCS43338.1 hypothetical protein DTL36_22860 [Bremerella cremea]
MYQLLKISVPLLIVAIVGCGDPGPHRLAVKGTLMLDGKPLPFKSLALMPIEGTGGHGAAGFSTGDGTFNLQAIVPGAIRDYRGCPPGRYRVVIGEPLIPISDEPVVEASMSEEEGPAPAIALDLRPRRRATKGGIPAIYRLENTTPLVVEVSEGIEAYEFKLDSKPKPGAVASVQYKR